MSSDTKKKPPIPPDDGPEAELFLASDMEEGTGGIAGPGSISDVTAPSLTTIQQMGLLNLLAKKGLFDQIADLRHEILRLKEKPHLLVLEPTLESISLFHPTLYEEIEGSQQLLTYEEDWDDEGAKPVDKKTLDRVIDFLIVQACWLWNHRSTRLPVPSILPCSDGSIDVHWELKDYEMLMNFIPDQPIVSFYGDDYGDQVIKGSLAVDSINEGFLLWLMKQM
jgi:hypothetical protein